MENLFPVSYLGDVHNLSLHTSSARCTQRDIYYVNSKVQVSSEISGWLRRALRQIKVWWDDQIG